MIVLDGATGTELARRGVETRTRLFSAAALLSDRGEKTLGEIHREYVEAGAQVVTAATFRTNARAAGSSWRELTERAVRIAKKSGAQAVAGSMAPVADCYRPDLRPPADVAREEHARMAKVLASAGCDLLLVETVAAADEGLAAVEAAVATGVPVWVAAMVMPDGRMKSGDDLRQFFEGARDRGARAALLNCVPADAIDRFFDPRAMDGAYPHMGEVDPDAGWPATPLLTPGDLAQRARSWNAKILGGCCGTTPAHIAALAALSPDRQDPCPFIGGSK